MTLTVRAADDSDAEQLARLSGEAFGRRPDLGRPAPSPTAGGRATYLAIDGTTAVGRIVDLRFSSWFGGRAVPTSGIASVSVALEHRGRGAVGVLLRHALDHARGRGAVISTLYPTAPAVYHRFGYGLIGAFEEVSVPTAALAQVPPGRGRLSRATAADWPDIAGLYARWAQGVNGAATRTGPALASTPETEFADGVAVTLARDEAGEPIGYASWERGGGYKAQGRLTVHDLVAGTLDGHRLLLRALGSFAPVAPRALTPGWGADTLRWLLPSDTVRAEASTPCLLTVLDVPGALAARGYPGWVDAEVTFEVRGEFPAGVDGAYRAQVRQGQAQVSRIDSAPTRFAPAGLAMAYAGSQSCATLRSWGLLSGDDRADEVFDVLFGGRRVAVRDYF